MIIFHKGPNSNYFVTGTNIQLHNHDLNKLSWLFGGAEMVDKQILEGYFIGPRKVMITPWSTNAVEITQNMGIKGIQRIEEFKMVESKQEKHDMMLQQIYEDIAQDIFTIEHEPEPVISVEDIAEYNKREGLALSEDEIAYLNEISDKLGRKLTDSEVFGFSQVNSEHCRHKIFNGTFIIDGDKQTDTLFGMIKKTAKLNHNKIVSAYNDNVAFVEGPQIEIFAPKTQNQPDFFEINEIGSVISIKAETHNFPTTVEPFNGAATGSGGEIRDRMAGGQGSFPLVGTAVYMTSYSRLSEDREWEKLTQSRKWLYQTPAEILIKASNGASDFGNKFGQPLICGSVLTFEHFETRKKYGYDKVIMLAGGVGYGKKEDSKKATPVPGDKIVVLGGDNYRIGMGGGAVSSVATGEYSQSLELNAVQRANPEMQKRVYNAIRALAESSKNPIISIHDHGAGGHLNSLSELVEKTGGIIYLDKLPIGDPTLSAKEIIGNESQERMGLVLHEKDIELLAQISERERAPMYVAGLVTGDMNFCFEDEKGNKPINLKLDYLFGKPPVTIIEDTTIVETFEIICYDPARINEYLEAVLQLESVACKDWLTNKVDRSVTGKIAKQQTVGSIQLPLNNLGVVALDFQGESGIATSIGHAPLCGLIDPEAGSILSIAEALTNIIWSPIAGGLKGISLSANWMWPCKNPGEDARLYKAVEAASKFAIDLGINIPTGKDSLSMKQKYPDGEEIFSPGTVIISAAGEVENIKNVVTPLLQRDIDTTLIYINFSKDSLKLGGSSFAQILNKLGTEVPTVKDPAYFRKAFNVIQALIKVDKILAGHDISAGGLITALLEMTFADNHTGLDIDLSCFKEDTITTMFSENPGIIIQVKDEKYVTDQLTKNEIHYEIIGRPSESRSLKVVKNNEEYEFDIYRLREIWYKTSYLLDKKQSGDECALKRYRNYSKQELNFRFNDSFKGSFSHYNLEPSRRQATGIKGAIIREKGVNCDRETAYAMYLAGFDVKDVHMTDLISGRENLEGVNFIVFVGGFSNSDVLGSAKGWAGAFLYNDKAKTALDNFYKRDDTLSMGICNGCQLMVELGLIYPEHGQKPKMLHNDTHKYESAFINVDILENESVLFKSLAGIRMGIWIAHGEGKFSLPLEEKNYHIPVKYSYDEFPGNPNGSDFATAAICSHDGRHVAIMPHLERAIFPWQWAHYPSDRSKDLISPWIEVFINAREWIKKTTDTGYFVL